MTEDKSFKMRSWLADIKQYNKFKSIVSGDGLDVGVILNELITNYNIEHGDGNPGFKITDFQDKDFIATPALARSPEDIRKYLEKIWGTPEWGKIGTILDEHWVKIYNEVEASHL